MWMFLKVSGSWTTWSYIIGGKDPESHSLLHYNRGANRCLHNKFHDFWLGSKVAGKTAEISEAVNKHSAALHLCEAITTTTAFTSSPVDAVQRGPWLCLLPRVQLIQTKCGCCLPSGLLCLCEIGAAVRGNLMGSANWETGWGSLGHHARLPTYSASGQLSTLQGCQPGRRRHREKLPWRRGDWIPRAFQWWTWTTSQIVHLPWHNSSYFREWGFQGRQWEQPLLFTEGGWHFFLLSGTSAGLVALCPVIVAAGECV